jgi:hypothetical protein
VVTVCVFITVVPIIKLFTVHANADSMSSHNSSVWSFCFSPM